MIMNTIYVASTVAEIWHDLVEEAEQEVHLQLEHEMEGYLVMTLIRYQNYAALQSHVLALDYFTAHQGRGQVRLQRLQQLGDISLLYSGLYPEQADRRTVGTDYFVKMGKSAYSAASAGAENALSEMFAELSSSFVPLMQVLRAVHDHTARERPTLLEAWDLWSGTGDSDAWQQLSQHGAIPVNRVGRA
jgi:hypothetical protein